MVIGKDTHNTINVKASGWLKNKSKKKQNKLL